MLFAKINRYQYAIAVLLPILLCFALHDLYPYRYPVFLLLLSGALLAGFMVVSKPILGLYVIIAMMCLSGGVLAINSGEENVIDFFSNLPFLPINFNFFELFSLSILVALYVLICLTKKLVIFEETRISHATYLFTLCIAGAWFIHSLSIRYFGGLYEIRRLMYSVLIFLLMFNLIENEKQLRFIVKLFVICTGIKAIFGLERIFLVHTKASLLYTDWGESTFFMSCIFLYVEFKNHLSDYPLVKQLRYLLVHIGLCYLFSGRRTLWASFFLTMLIYTLFIVKIGRIKVISGILFLFVVAVLIGIFSGNQKLITSMESMLNPLESHNFIVREWEWKNAWAYIKMKPILGWGFGTILLPIVDFMYIFRSGFTSMIIHNNYLWIWVKGGIFCLSGLLAVICVVVRSAYVQYKHTSDPFYKSVLLGILLSFVNFFIAGFVSPTMADLKINLWLGFMLGLTALIKKFDTAVENKKK